MAAARRSRSLRDPLRGRSLRDLFGQGVETEPAFELREALRAQLGRALGQVLVHRAVLERQIVQTLGGLAEMIRDLLAVVLVLAARPVVRRALLRERDLQGARAPGRGPTGATDREAQPGGEHGATTIQRPGDAARDSCMGGSGKLTTARRGMNAQKTERLAEPLALLVAGGRAARCRAAAH